MARWRLPLVGADEKKVEYGLKVGQNMPFHVVDFESGPKKGAGCPSVMISNGKTRGILVWARKADGKVLEFAKGLQVSLGKSEKAQGYLVVFNNPANLGEWDDPRIDEQFDAVWDLVQRGLTKGIKKAVKARAAATR